MNRKLMTTFVLLGVVVLFSQGMAAVGIKQLSRNNLNEETIAEIKLCETTKEQIIETFRAPTEDYTRMQGEYAIYTYYGFSSRGGLKKQKLEVMINPQGIVVDKQFNYEGEELMKDRCQ